MLPQWRVNQQIRLGKTGLEFEKLPASPIEVAAQ